MDRIGVWLWFGLAVAALVAAVAARGLAALFYLLAIALCIAGIVAVVRKP